MSENKKNILAAVRDYFKSVGAELKKVSWPGRQMVVASTLIILVICFFTMFYVGGIDFVLTRVVNWLVNLTR